MRRRASNDISAYVSEYREQWMAKMSVIKKLLFVDTNIWLDFYRPVKSDAIQKWLEHLESVTPQIISTHLLEMEYKKNRQGVIVESYSALNPPRKNCHTR